MQDSNNWTNPDNEKENEFSLVEIVFQYLKYWQFFVVSMVLCVSLAIVYLRFATPLYKAASTAIVRDGTYGTSGIELTAFNDLGITYQSGSLYNEIEMLKSRALMKNVVDSLKANVLYYKDDFFRKQEIYRKSPVWINVNEFKKAGSFMIDKTEGDAFTISAKEPMFTKKIFAGEVFDSPWGLLTVYENPDGKEKFPVTVSVLKPGTIPKVSVSLLNKGMSNVVEISIILPNADRGKDVVNTLIDIYNKQVIEDKNFVATNTIYFIKDRLDAISQELDKAEKDVEAYKREKNLTDLKTEAHIFLSATNEYNQKISDLDIQTSFLRTITDFITTAQGAEGAISANIGLTDPTVIRLIGSYNELLLDKKRVTTGMKPGNPILQEYDERIASMKENLLKGISIEESRLKSVRAELTKQESLYVNKIRGLSTQEREFQNLYRNKNVVESLYMYLLQKREETALSLALATPNAKVIDKALGASRIKPEHGTTILVAIILGFFIPVCIIFIIRLFKFRLESKEELIAVVKAPFLGEIPISKNDEVFPVRELRSRCAENFRIIAANLSFLLGEENSKVILVTSTAPREGKSFFARNLALSLATSGHKTLLIDADIRKSKLDNIINLHTDKGLAQYLADPEVQIDDVIEKTGDWSKNLHIIPTKIYPPNPAELLSSKRLNNLFAQVRELYDYVIVDTPPVGLVADAFRINQFVNASIYVTRMGYTHKETLKEIREFYESRKLYNMSCIINGVAQYNRYGYRTSDYYQEKLR